MSALLFLSLWQKKYMPGSSSSLSEANSYKGSKKETKIFHRARASGKKVMREQGVLGSLLGSSWNYLFAVAESRSAACAAHISMLFYFYIMPRAHTLAHYTYILHAEVTILHVFVICAPLLYCVREVRRSVPRTEHFELYTGSFLFARMTITEI